MGDIKLVKLKDGAVMIYRKHKMKCTAVEAGFVFCGNRNKYPEPTAHFCEHMLFQGSQHLSDKEIKEKKMTILPYLNASTNINCLYMHIFRSNKLLTEALALSSEMLLFPSFSPKKVEKEKGVIKQEFFKRKSQADFNFYAAKNQCIRNHYNLISQVVGTEEEIEGITPQILKKFYRDIAIRQNFVCAVATQLPLFKIKRLINKYFIEPMNSNPNYSVDKALEHQYDFEKSGNMIVKEFPRENTKGCITINLGKMNEKDQIIAGFLSTMFTQKNIGGYFSKLREKGLVYSAIASFITNKYENYLDFEFNCSQDNVNKIIDVIANLICSHRKELYSDQDLTYIKNLNDYIEDEKTYEKSRLARGAFKLYLYDDEKYFKNRDKKRREKIKKSLTSVDIKDFFNKYFSKKENIYVTIMTNSKENNFYSYEQIVDKIVPKSR